MRKLSLKKETLAELTSSELAGVAGGSGLSCVNCASDFQQCITGVGCVTGTTTVVTATIRECLTGTTTTGF